MAFDVCEKSWVHRPVPPKTDSEKRSQQQNMFAILNQVCLAHVVCKDKDNSNDTGSGKSNDTGSGKSNDTGNGTGNGH